MHFFHVVRKKRLLLFYRGNVSEDRVVDFHFFETHNWQWMWRNWSRKTFCSLSKAPKRKITLKERTLRWYTGTEVNWDMEAEVRIWNYGQECRRVLVSRCLAFFSEVELHQFVYLRQVQRHGHEACGFQRSSDFRLQNTGNTPMINSLYFCGTCNFSYVWVQLLYHAVQKRSQQWLQTSSGSTRTATILCTKLESSLPDMYASGLGRFPNNWRSIFCQKSEL